ncbi:hypothetical protein ACLK1T_10805 [Escherichia coli]
MTAVYSAGIDGKLFRELCRYLTKQAKKICRYDQRAYSGVDAKCRDSLVVMRNPQTGWRESAMDMVKILSREGVKDFHFYTLTVLNELRDLPYAGGSTWFINSVAFVKITQ